MKPETKIAIFRGQKIRKTIYQSEWWFSVVDIIETLTDSVNARDYWFKMKIRVKNEDGAELSTICRQLKLIAPDGKMRETDCANTENIFRIIQSIPSSKAEPFKMWLAKVGYERVQEIDDPELAIKRSRAIYKATFGMTPSEYKKFKGLRRENLRDHMDDMELILSMLGEATTTKFSQVRDSKGFPKLKTDARDGGAVAGRTRKDIEEKSGKKVSTKQNYLKFSPTGRIGRG